MGLGFKIAAISPDTPDKLQPTVDKNELEYGIYSDIGNVAAQAFGIAWRVDDKTAKQYRGYGIPLDENNPTLPVPAVFVYDKKGTLTFEYVHPDYKTRLAPGVLLAAAKAAVSKK